MLFANIFGKIAGVIFYVCIGVSIVMLAYGGIKRLVDFIRTKKKIRQAEKDVLDLNDDKKRKKDVR